jgi:hypothetical protein
MKILAVILASVVTSIVLENLTDYWQLSYYPKHAIITLGIITPYLFFDIKMKSD